MGFLLIGCWSSNQKQQTGSLPIIDLSKNHPTKEIILQDIADIEYIPLETTNDILLGQFSNLNYVSDNYIIISDILQGIFIFNRKGKIISHINCKGNGPQEYIQIGLTLFDENNKELFITDSSTRRFLVYSINGEFKRAWKFADDLLVPLAYNFDEETILIYNNDGFMPNNYNKSEKPYSFMSKKDGSIQSNIDIRLNVRYSTKITQEIDLGGGQKGFTSLSIMIPFNNLYFGNDFVIADMSSDTIYRLSQNKELTPILVRTPSVHSSSTPTVWANILTTDKFIVLYTTVLDLVARAQNRDIPSNILMYELDRGKVYKVTFANDDGFITKNFPLNPTVVDINKNMFANMLQPSRLKEAYEAKQLRGLLEKLVSKIDVEDNPIIAIYKFK